MEEKNISLGIETDQKKKAYYNSKYRKAKSEWTQWTTVWDVCYKYAQMIDNYTTGAETCPNVNLENMDSYPINASEKLAGILKGFLFPSGGQTFFLETEDKFKNNPNIVADISKMSKRLIAMIDIPESYADSAIYEAMIDLVVGGTVGLRPRIKGKNLFFKSYGPKDLIVDTDSDGQINSFFMCLKLQNHEIMDIYGEKNLPQDIKEQIREGKLDETNNIIWLVAPNVFRDPEAADNRNMPFVSIHMVEKCGTFLKESGFHELPIKIGRPKVRASEKYGRSYLMPSIADVRNMSIANSMIMQAAELMVQPMIGYYMGALGVDTLDFKAGEWIPFDESKTPQGRNPTFPIFDVGDLNVLKQQYNDFKSEIADNFMLDRLLDFNSNTQMTAQETRLRAAMRNQSSNGMLSRVLAELITPTISRSFNLAYEAGLLGCFKDSEEYKNFKEAFPFDEPDIITKDTYKALLEGESVYKITYVTEASRIIKSDEIQSLTSFLNLLMSLREVWPESQMLLKGEDYLRRLASLFGVDQALIRTTKETEQIKENMMKAEAQKAQALSRQQNAQTQVLENEAANSQPQA
jgi:hypothetical protein